MSPDGRSMDESPVTSERLTPELIELWRERLEAVNRDVNFVLPWDSKRELREDLRPEARELLRQFLDAEIGLREFQKSFQHNATGRWRAAFGFGGPNGAMLLNIISKHTAAPEETAEILRRSVAVPANPAVAREKLEALLEYLEREFAHGRIKRAQVSGVRIAFFLSATWWIQDPARWPVAYPNTLTRLEKDGIISRADDPFTRYLVLREAVLRLADALGVTSFEVERICIWNPPPPPPPEGPRVWLYSPGRNAAHFDRFRAEKIAAIGWEPLGDLAKYEAIDDVKAALEARERKGEGSVANQARMCWEFAHAIRVGDFVVAKDGRKTIVAVGRVTSPYRHEPGREPYPNVIGVDWIESGRWELGERSLAMKTLTKITGNEALLEEITALTGVELAPSKPGPGGEIYTYEHAEKELFLESDYVRTIVETLERKKNIVLQGPPGVGKTYVAKRLAYLLNQAKLSDEIALVQFHQSYSYEDFIQGYRPDGSGFSRRNGPFLRVCEQASQDPGARYVMIIDEINRANLSKVFGELLMLIEADKRSPEYGTTLAYSRPDEPAFHVPENVYIIGTMNTADRSLALVDYALRRRFAFFDVEPAFGMPAFDAHLEKLGMGPAFSEKIRTKMGELNAKIESDPALGRGFLVGHSYFCDFVPGDDPSEWFENVIKFEIAPLLREYFFDQPERVEELVDPILAED